MDNPSSNASLRRLQWLLLISSLVSIGFLLLAAFEENLTGEWRAHQKDYRQRMIEKADSDTARDAAKDISIGFKQVFLPQLDRVDRCVTCHLGADDPTQTDAPQPLTTHSGDLLKRHPVDKFGCTICHDGQGRTVEKDSAHGDVPYWPKPLLKREHIYTSCGKCHYENDLYGAESDLYARGGPLPPLDESELTQSVPGSSNPDDRAIGRGKQLVLASGCLGCHQYRGRGGLSGPDITYEGEKTPHDFDFTHLKGERTVMAWLYEHFKDPEAVSPKTQMPDFNLSDQQASDLAIYMLSLKRKDVPASYTPVPDRRVTAPVQAPRLFEMLCSACHGQKGRGVSYFNNRNTSVPALRYTAERLGLYDPEHAEAVVKLLESHADLTAVAADPPFDPDTYEEFLKQLEVMRDVIRNGRQGVKKDPQSPLDPVNMPTWKDTLTDEQIDDILAYLISLFPWEEE
jgi:mono/diheme cytochrome c family protein